MLHRGSKGEKVESLQRRLSSLGFLAVEQVDGIFGPRTEQAVRAFQLEHGIVRSTRGGVREPIGVVNAETADALACRRDAPSAPTQFWLTIYGESSLPSEWPENAIAFDAWSVKLMQDSGKDLRGSAAASRERVLAAARARQIAVHGWHYSSSSDVESAWREGRAAATAAGRFGVSAYHWDAEAALKRSRDPIAVILAFESAWRNECDLPLYYNGFTSVRLTSGKVVNLITPDVIRRYDGFEPMLYGTHPSTIARKWTRHLGSAWLPPDKRRAMVGTGRMAPNGQVWGFLRRHDGHPGLLDIAQRIRPASINFFRSIEQMLSDGNKVNPPLWEQVALLRQALRSGPK